MYLAKILMVHPVLHPYLLAPFFPRFPPFPQSLPVPPVSPRFPSFPPRFPPFSLRFPVVPPHLPPPFPHAFPHFSPFSRGLTYREVYRIWIHPGPACGACQELVPDACVGTQTAEVMQRVCFLTRRIHRHLEPGSRSTGRRWPTNETGDRDSGQATGPTCFRMCFPSVLGRLGRACGPGPK